MNKLTFLLAATVIALGGLSYGQYERNKALGAQNKSLTEAVERAAEREKQDRKVLVARQAEIASQARKLKQANAALSEALNSETAVYLDSHGVLQRNKSWSDTDVPSDVQKALQGRSDSPAADPDGVR